MSITDRIQWHREKWLIPSMKPPDARMVTELANQKHLEFLNQLEPRQGIDHFRFDTLKNLSHHRSEIDGNDNRLSNAMFTQQLNAEIKRSNNRNVENFESLPISNARSHFEQNPIQKMKMFESDEAREKRNRLNSAATCEENNVEDIGEAKSEPKLEHFLRDSFSQKSQRQRTQSQINFPKLSQAQEVQISTITPEQCSTSAVALSQSTGYAEFTETDFAGLAANGACLNAGATVEGMEIFMEKCRSYGGIAMAILWADLTSSLSDWSKKLCTPKKKCFRGNCSCEEHVRANRANLPIIGAIICFPQMDESNEEYESDDLDGVGFLLPLAPCNINSSDNEKSNQNSKGGETRLPIQCNTTLDQRWDTLSTLLETEEVTKIVFNAQLALMPVFGRKRNHRISRIFDPKVASWMLDTSLTEKSLEFAQIQKFLCIEAECEISPAEGIVSSFVLRTLAELRTTLLMAKKLTDNLEEQALVDVFWEVEMPLVPILAAMETEGIAFHPDRVAGFTKIVNERITELETNARSITETRNFNPSSPEQVAEVLYNKLKLPSPDTKMGAKHPPTGEAVLESLINKHPVVAVLLQHRGLCKIRQAFLTKLVKFHPNSKISDEFPRIYVQWYQLSCHTGRLSCSRPNLQQLPCEKDYSSFGENLVGLNLRSVIRSSRNCVLVASDYCQLEMRILAEVSRDTALCGFFQHDCHGDIYKEMAGRIFKMNLSEVTEDEKSTAKVICLGAIYGIGAVQVAKKLKIELKAASQLISSFLKTYPGVQKFITEAQQFARQHGYVKTITGRKRHLPSIHSSNKFDKSQAERQAVNSLIQGTAADIINIGMILISRELDEWKTEDSAVNSNFHPSLRLQLHDELIFDCPANEEDIQRLKDIITEQMGKGVKEKLKIATELKIKLSVGLDWGNLRHAIETG